VLDDASNVWHVRTLLPSAVASNQARSEPSSNHQGAKTLFWLPFGGLIRWPSLQRLQPVQLSKLSGLQALRIARAPDRAEAQLVEVYSTEQILLNRLLSPVRKKQFPLETIGSRVKSAHWNGPAADFPVIDLNRSGRCKIISTISSQNHLSDGVGKLIGVFLSIFGDSALRKLVMF
jgi:hypothetical protein